MEKEMIRVVDTDGVELDVELISILEDKEENYKYYVKIRKILIAAMFIDGLWKRTKGKLAGV